MPKNELDITRLPRHIAIIMDGNGRWAKQRGLPTAAGHEAGAKSVRAVVEGCRELERVEALTLYAFSTENWRRTKREINALFRLMSKYIKLELEELHAQDIRITIMGIGEGLSAKSLRELEYCRTLTQHNRSMTLNVAINYGSRREIADAMRAIASDVKAGRLREEDIDEACFQRYLYQPALPDCDLLIRSSGEQRLSNFLLWQAAHAEIVTPAVLWPDFRKRHLHAAIVEYQRRVAARGK